MFPETQDQPAASTQFSRPSEIALAVATDLLHPVDEVRLRHVAVATFRAAVPEATVDEDGDFGRPEDEVGLAWKVGFQPVSTHPTRREFAPQAKFWLRISRANSRHVERARALVMNVHDLRKVELQPVKRKSSKVIS
jgi:hypothetical protein